MVKYVIKLNLVLAFSLLSFSFSESELPLDFVKQEMEMADCFIENLNAENAIQNLPSTQVIKLAFVGYEKMLKENSLAKTNILTIIDFSLPSTAKRLWILDIENAQVLSHTYVAHGQKTGNNYAETFSNKPESHCSSLGFYVAGETYQGKHGLSLFMDGIEQNINHNARSRYVVIHGAEYVSESFIKQNGRLGRSFGCPAIPMQETENIINTIKDKSCIFIYHPSKEYFRNSRFFNSNQNNN
jgi:hypothetical protein